MNSRVFVSIAAALMLCGNAFAQRTETLLEKGWRFHLGEADASASSPGFDDSSWEEVTVPHDWAIYGPFDVSNDLQTVAVTQNFENEASMKTGRTGGLPYVGIGWYRTVFRVPYGRRAVLLFDGAMSEARVYVNGEQVCFWPYGYSSFWCDVTDVLTDGDNVLAVRLENLPQSSRWYPGAGLYRNVHLITTGDVHIPVWGTRVTTPDVDSLSASVRIETKVENADGKDLLYVTVKVMDKDGNLCPADSREMEFSVSGAASYRASANGDPTCLYIFHKPVMPAFNGMLTVIVCSGDAPGKATLTVRTKGLRPASLDIEVR